MSVAIIDYDVCNVGSILNMLKRIGVPAGLVSTPAGIESASALVLPGVGAFDAGMDCLRARGLVEPLRARVLGDGVPVLGICLGAQLMTRGSEEGQREGLGFFDAQVRRFRFDEGERKIPHIGWNWVMEQKPSSILDSFAQTPRFYFVHSYYIECNSSADVLASTDYGVRFTSAIERDNRVGVQFHPEKSHNFGMQLFTNFARRFAAVA